MPRYGTIDPDYAMRLATCEPDADGPVYMLNLMKYRERADYAGTSAHGDGLSGREADDRYAPFDVLAEIGASVCFVADVVQASEDWDRVAVVRYPTRRSFIDMQSRKDFQDKHVHKEAGMDHTIVMGTTPGGAVPSTGSSQMLLEVWDGEPATPTEDDFDVEGTILGDGRRWTCVRYRVISGTADLTAASPSHQMLVLRPFIERWS